MNQSNEILNWVKKARSTGLSNQEIRENLIKSGWNENEINHLLAFDFNEKKPVNILGSANQSKKGGSSKNILMIILLIIIILAVGGGVYWFLIKGKSNTQNNQNNLNTIASSNANLNKNENSETNNNACIYGCLKSYEKKVVWGEIVDFPRQNLYLLDTETNKKTVINPEPADIVSYSLYENKYVIWTEIVDSKNSLKNLYLQDIETNKKTVINPEPTHISSFAMYEDKIVYIDDRKNGNNNEDWTAWLKNLTTNEEIELFTAGADILKFYKNKIVFIESNAMYGEKLSVYDLSTKTMTNVINEYESISCVDMYEDKIVYKNVDKIYLLDLTKMSETKIGEDGITTVIGRNCPSIYKNKVAYGVGNYPDGVGTEKINLYDIDTNKTEEITKLEKTPGLGEFEDMWIVRLVLHENEIKYVVRVLRLLPFDNYVDTDTCTKIDINSKKKEDVSCKGGVDILYGESASYSVTNI